MSIIIINTWKAQGNTCMNQMEVKTDILIEVGLVSTQETQLQSSATRTSSSHHLRHALAITMVSFSTDFDAGCPDLD